MPEHVSILQLTGVVGLALVTATWVILLRTRRRARAAAVVRHSGPVLQALPHQRQAPPHRESVELTPAERDAFAGLMRRLDER
ncbi:hypothetical protein [Streptomyces sp. HUAS TT20]|jgi:hypothetical protein|uniref:hypothetical protein n=1 Tax=Streptomyces sp. HUAS TT20 TaxID=3447509 RepID=UPI0021D85E85|nr:hypothetical protein [Streptomyces sp. HUAS 15-9]UXY28109.1 hypothetical protein N8I87_17040 [Streptomyces sp. HUAS 15-9]